MLTDLYWIDGVWHGRLAIAPRPRGGDWLEDEVRAWRQAGVDVVVSLLTKDEASDLELSGEGESCQAAGIDYYSLPIIDRSIPDSETDVVRVMGALQVELSCGRNVVVHCRQGIGRSGLIASGLLIEKGLHPEEAIRRVSDARHAPIPETAEQRSWIDSFAATVNHRS